MAEQKTPGDDPNADPPPIPPPPPIDWGQDPSRPPLHPWAAPPPYAVPEPPAPPEGAATETPEHGDPWRIPPQPPWNPAAGSPPVPANQPPPQPPPQPTGPGPHGPGPRQAQPPPNATGPRAPAPGDRARPGRFAYGPGGTPAPQLPPSAAVPRSSPLPPDVPRRAEAAPASVRFDEPWRRDPRTRRRSGPRPRTIVLAVAAVAVAGLIAGGLIVLSGGGSSPVPAGPQAQLAGRLFPSATAATADGRGQGLAGVTAVGSTVVAIGGEDDDIGHRPEFLVSTDGGRSFRLAAVRTPGGDEPPYGDAPTKIASTDGAWVALGTGTDGAVVWTSRDGTSWTRQPDTAGAAFGRNDRIAGVAAGRSGFVAVGATSVKGGDPTPVVWLSADGRRWQRLTGGQLSLPGAGARMSLVGVAASGSVLIVHGVGRGAGKHPKPTDGVWRSADGGRTWQQVTVPRPAGAGGFGIAAIPSALLIAREARDKSGRFATVYSSTDGSRWSAAGEIRMPGYDHLLRFTGASQGLTAVAAAGRQALLMRSADGGKSWQSAGAVPLPSGRVLTDVVASPGRTVLIGRDGAGDDADPLLIVRDGQGQDVPVPPIPGAVRPDKAVTAVAAVAGRVVAVGSAGGDAAVWNSADGRVWRPARTPSLSGTQRLTAVAAGDAGWLAVGLSGGAPRHPLVLTSADGAAWQRAGGPFRADAALSTYSATLGPAGYVVVGEDRFSAAVWFSPDLKSWQRGSAKTGADLRGTAKTGRWMRDVASGSFGYVAVGGLNDPSSRTGRPSRPAVWTSADGRGWVLRRVPLPAGAVGGWFDHVAARGSVLVATGTATGTSGPQAFAFVSGDGGRTWQEARLSQGGGVRVSATAATPKGFVVAGAAGPRGSADVALWTSADGRTWTSVRPHGTGLSGRGEQRLTGLTAVGGDLLAVGVTADHTGTQPTLWRRPLP